MSRPLYILAHTLASGAFMFVLQTFALRATTETAAVWAIVFGLAAAGLAWHQSNR
jgi:hypothetical protein